jgi:hypothetical protein
MSRRLAESAVLIGSMVFSNDSNLDRQFASIASGRFDSQGSVVGPRGLATALFNMCGRLGESAILIASTVLSNDSNSHRQFAPTPSPPIEFRGSIVGPQGLHIMVSYMSKRLSESALLIGSTVLSNDSNSHGQFTSIAPWPFDSQRSVVGPQGLNRMVFYMSQRLDGSALLIASTLLSNDSNSHGQFASIAPWPFNSRRSVVGPPALAETLYYMSKRLSESGLLIASTLRSND